MDGWEEKLSSFLSDPAAMAQLRQLAGALGGGGAGGETAEAAPPSPAAGMPEGQFAELMGSVLRAYGAPSEASKLVSALKPLLRQERAERLDRALRIARLVHAGKDALPGLLPSLTGGKNHV